MLPSLRGLAGEDVLVVVTTGGPSRVEVEAAHGGPLPANALVTPFIPYEVMFRHASAVVTNGGYTGVTLALSHGLPLVQAGTTEEKSEIGARIRWTGVGVALRTTPAEAGGRADRRAAGPHRAVVPGRRRAGAGGDGAARRRS